MHWQKWKKQPWWLVFGSPFFKALVIDISKSVKTDIGRRLSENSKIFDKTIEYVSVARLVTNAYTNCSDVLFFIQWNV